MKDETQDRMRSTGEQFRLLSGLPPREDDKPITSSGEVSELRRFAEPEGGLGGRGETEESETEDEGDSPDPVQEADYRDLQAEAKDLGVPANQGKEALAEQIEEEKGEPAEAVQAAEGDA